jgi:hypothetical protein
MTRSIKIVADKYLVFYNNFGIKRCIKVKNGQTVSTSALYVELYDTADDVITKYGKGVIMPTEHVANLHFVDSGGVH